MLLGPIEFLPGPNELPSREQSRLLALHRYQILDTPAEESFDSLVKVVHALFNTTIVSISFVDTHRVWVKAATGLQEKEFPRATSFCHRIIESGHFFEADQTDLEPAFAEIYTSKYNRLKFYAGVPITTGQGHHIGTLCIADYESRALTEEEKNLLSIMSKQVMTQIEFNASTTELQRKKRKLESSFKRLDNFQAELDQIAYAVSHELKSPLRAINNLAEWVSEELHDTSSREIKRNLLLMRGRVQRLENLFNGLISYSKARKATAKQEMVNTFEMVTNLADVFYENDGVDTEVQKDMPVILTEKEPLLTIFSHLIQNSIIHNKTVNVKLNIGWKPAKTGFVTFWVKDNGIGIEPAYHEQIFKMFKTLNVQPDQKSIGLGLTLVLKLLNERDSSIWVESALNQGSTFYFTWPA